MSVIDEVKQQTDIVDVVSQYVKLTKSGRNLRGLCPFHSEKNPSFYVYPEQQSWHCFGACGTGGDVFSFIMKKEGIDFGEALRLLAERAHVTVPSRIRPEAVGEKERIYQVNQAATQYFHNLLLNSAAGQRARSYLAGRGLSEKTIADFQLGFSLDSWDALKQYLSQRDCTENELVMAGLLTKTDEGRTFDRFRNRLMFPICEIRGNVIGFGARVFDDSLPKYLNSAQTPVFDKGSTLYGINLAAAAIRQQQQAVIVEGYMDVITAHQNGFSNVVASMGTALTEKHVSALKRLTRNMVLALDADAAGNEATLRSVGYENILDTEIKVIILPSGKDPDDVIKQDRETWQRLLGEALSIFDYTLEKMPNIAAACETLFPHIAETKDDIRQNSYLNRIAKRFGVPITIVEASFKAYLTGRSKRPRKEVLARSTRPLLSHPLEEYYLALLLQHPELKDSSQSPLPEYFESSENREIFIASQQRSDLSSLKEKLDESIWEHLERLANKSLPPEQIREKYVDSVLRLKKEYHRNMERKREAALASEAESGGVAAALASLQEHGMENSVQLRDIFTQIASQGQGKGDEK
ncbi:DNA primase [Chloroflexota bacterium]